MKNTTKKLLAAVMTALLVAVAFVGVAAAGTTIAFEDKNTSMTGVYEIGDKYWAVENKSVEIPVNASSTDAKVLSGFDLNLSIKNQTPDTATFLTGDSDYKFLDLRGNWYNETNSVGNNLRVATSGGNLSVSSTYAKLFSVNITENVLKATKEDGTKPYVITIDSIKLANSTVEWASILTTDDVKLEDTITADTFDLYVLKVPEIKNVTFKDYYIVEFGDEQKTIVLYSEHVEGAAGQVNTTVAIDNPAVTGAADTLLASSDATSNFTVSRDSVKPFTATGNEINLTKQNGGTGKYVLSIDNFTAATEKNVSVIYTPWNKSVTDNYASTATYNDASHWSFVTAYNRTYEMGYSNVSASASNPWDTGVIAANLSRNTTSLPASAQIWNGTVHYNTTGGVKADDYHNLTTSGDVLKFNGTTFKVYEVEGTESVGDDVKNIVSFIGYCLGDANTDGKTNIVDSSVVGIDILKSAGLLKDDERIYADCNSATGDGAVTVDDMRAINRYLVGLDPWGTS